MHGALNNKRAEFTRVEIAIDVGEGICTFLAGLDLSNLDLSGLNLSFAVVKNVCFSNTILRETLFTIKFMELILLVPSVTRIVKPNFCQIII